MTSRIKNSMLNSSVSSLIYLFRTILGFVSRTFFIKLLGIEILGLNGLFTNVLSFLSLTELGIGTSIVVELYKPIAFNNRESIKSLMRLYKRAYDAIGLAVGLIGIAIMPILPYVMKDYTVTPVVYLYYVLFLANSVVSYFFTYKRSMLNANQANYVTVINDFGFYVVSIIAQIGCLILWRSFIAYLVVQIITTALSNLNISRIVDKRYPFINEKDVQPVSKEVKAKLLHNIVGNVSNQIGSIVVLGSDNILISSFVGLAAVGLYSNYTLITNAIKGVITQATNAVVPTVGNLVVSSETKHSVQVFKSYHFVNSTMSFLAGVGTFAFINNFVRVWLGGKYVLPVHTAALMSVYVAALLYQGSARTFYSAYGLFWQQRWKPVFESLVNLGVSIFLLWGFHLGIDGVLLGTLTSTFIVDLWFEPFVLFRFGFHQSLRPYLVKTGGFYLRLALGVFAKIQIMFKIQSISSFVIYLSGGLVVLLVLYLLLFGFDPQLRSLIVRARKIFTP